MNIFEKTLAACIGKTVKSYVIGDYGITLVFTDETFVDIESGNDNEVYLTGTCIQSILGEHALDDMTIDEALSNCE